MMKKSQIKKSKSTQTTLTLLDIEKMMSIASITYSDRDDASSEEDNENEDNDDNGNHDYNNASDMEIMEIEEAMLSDDDMGLLHEEALILIDEFIKSKPLLFSNPDFETIVYDHVQSILHFSINYRRYDDDEYAGENDECDEDENETLISCQIDELINVAMHDYFKFIRPHRSYKYSFIRKSPNMEKMKKKNRILRVALSARAKNRRVVFTSSRANYSQFGLESVWFTVGAKSADIRKMHAV